MKIAVDTNVLFSFFWQESLTRKLLITSNFELISPELALEEIEKYAQEIKRKLKITDKAFREQLDKLKEIVKFYGKKEYSQFLKEALAISPDKNDAEFFALCLKHSCFLWSNDLLLKNQIKIKVLSTEDIIELIF
ncbi:MAG: PIN domain-containing protein [Nanoarchaeota archaeon]|nr:PIN domain-containing protein [Nanoarchaeota archaeon]